MKTFKMEKTFWPSFEKQKEVSQGKNSSIFIKIHFPIFYLQSKVVL